MEKPSGWEESERTNIKSSETRLVEGVLVDGVPADSEMVDGETSSKDSADEKDYQMMGEQSDEHREGRDQQVGESVETKSLLIGIGVVIAVIVVVLAAVKLYPLIAPEPSTIAELHQTNLLGELSSDKGVVYRGYSFVKLDGLWWGEINRDGVSVHIRLHYNPLEVENVSINGSLNDSFNVGAEVYQAINPEVANKYYTLALTELNSNVVQGINRKIVAACTKEDPICENRAILSCNNTQGLPVIELIVDEEAFVELKGSCIGIHGEQQDLVRSAERMLYHWYGVMR